MNPAEVSDSFECFSSCCRVSVTGSDGRHEAHEAVARARRQLLEWHGRFSRFLTDSELSRVNRDPREELAVSPVMAQLAAAVRWAGEFSGGLVDGTLVGELERSGYDHDLSEPMALAQALRLAGPRRPASADPRRRWAHLSADPGRGLLWRTPGTAIDSGGLAKGLFADLLGAELAGHDAFAVDCAGDVRIGGAHARSRRLHVESPFEQRRLHTFEVLRTAAATSGIGRRSWLDGEGRPAHHLLDPASGRAAYTGIVQVTALAPSALEAEVRAKAALLSGPGRARGWLAGGGLLVFDDGSQELIEPPPTIVLSSPSATPQLSQSPLLQIG